MGLTGYYRKFVKNYSAIAQSLTQLLKKNSFLWNPEADHAFENLKLAMVSPLVLKLPDFSKVFVVKTDTSRLVVGAVLMQEGHPLAFMSQALKGKQLAWSTYEKEMFTIIVAVAKWCPYLMGANFVIRTDHLSLKHMVEQHIHTPAQQKWLVNLLGYDFDIE